MRQTPTPPFQPWPVDPIKERLSGADVLGSLYQPRIAAAKFDIRERGIEDLVGEIVRNRLPDYRIVEREPVGPPTLGVGSGRVSEAVPSGHRYLAERQIPHLRTEV